MCKSSGCFTNLSTLDIVYYKGLFCVVLLLAFYISLSIGYALPFQCNFNFVFLEWPMVLSTIHIHVAYLNTQFYVEHNQDFCLIKNFTVIWIFPYCLVEALMYFLYKSFIRKDISDLFLVIDTPVLGIPTPIKPGSDLLFSYFLQSETLFPWERFIKFRV